MNRKLDYPTKSHPGKAGRKPAELPSFLKRFRATAEEQAEFLRLLPGDAREDFLQIMRALKISGVSDTSKVTICKN